MTSFSSLLRRVGWGLRRDPGAPRSRSAWQPRSGRRSGARRAATSVSGIAPRGWPAFPPWPALPAA